jgi:hypothetical protein
MPLPTRHVGAALTMLFVAVLSLAGCGRLKQQMKSQVDNDPQTRQQVVASARQSCVKTASEKLPDPSFQPKIASYCDCFATRGLSSFSNSELAGVAFRGGQFTPEQQKKMTAAVQMCASAVLARPATVR